MKFKGIELKDNTEAELFIAIEIVNINNEEELKKFHSSLDVNEAEDAIYNRDLTDITDILKELMKDEKKKIRR